MTNIHAHSLREISERISLPFFLFALILMLALGCSFFALLPRMTTLEIAGSVRDIHGLQEYTSQLQEEIAFTEEERNALIAPVQNTQYHTLIGEKFADTSINTVLASLQDLTERLEEVFDVPVIFIQNIDYDASGRTISLTGDVRNVGTRSMTVLAQFTDAIRNLPFVSALPHPRFAREQHDDIGMYSPFVLTLSLR